MSSRPLVALFDDTTTGHHAAFVAGVVRALSRRASPPLVFAPAAAALTEAFDHRPVPSLDRWDLIRRRRQISRALEIALREGAGVFVDLDLDKNVFAFPPERGCDLARIHVLHHVTQYLEPSGVRRILPLTLRHRIGRCASVVVHTTAARDCIAEIVGEERVTRLPYPVSKPPPGEWAGADADHVLFVGGARHHKGAYLLVEAASRLRLPVRFVGQQPMGRIEELVAVGSFDGIEFVDRRITDQELMDEVRSAALVVLPYTNAFGESGGASGVLLDVLRLGAPAVVTTAISDQLPDGYGGAVVAEADSVMALTDALETGMKHHSELARSAAEAGPSFIRSQHSFERYVEGLLGRR